MAERTAVVVGAGVGGLAAAVSLASRGVGVTVVERHGRPGGKLRAVQVGGAAIDAGPTVLTLKPVFAELFADAGGDLDAAVRLEPAEVIARHLWPDGSALDLHADPAASEAAVGMFAGSQAAREWRAFAQGARETWETLETAFVRDPAPSLPKLMLKAGLRGLTRLDPYATLAATLERAFTDPRLRQLYGRYATYVGSSPYEAPATLSLIAHVEQMGVWRAPEGLWRLAEAMAALAGRLGAVFRYGETMEEITVAGGRAAGVRLAGGETIAADAVVFDGDAGALGGGVLGRGASGAGEALAVADRSFSALTAAVRAKVTGVPLAHHTVLFSPDYRAEFNDLAAGRIPADPTVYVCAEDRAATAGATGPKGEERLFFIVNAPPLGDRGRPDGDETARALAQARANLARAGVEVDWKGAEARVVGPCGFEALFPGSGGALYGARSTGAMSAFRRPVSKSRLAGLHLCGGGVHPGPGLPMAALSGRAAADGVLAGFARGRR